MLRHDTLQKFNQAVAALYQPDLTVATYERKCYELLNAIVPSEFIVFGSLNLDNQNLSLDINESVPDFPLAMESFGNLMGQYELFRWDPNVNAGKPFYRGDFYSKREFQTLDIYSEVYTKIGADNHCAIHIPSNQNEIAFFGIERVGTQDFTHEEKLMIELCQTHLSNARKLAFSIAEHYDARVSPAHLAGASLTAREAEVLSWLAEGKSNDEIAMLLRIGIYTVKDHLKAIFQKIGAHNRLEAALWAIRTSLRQRARNNLGENVTVRPQIASIPSKEG